MRAAMNYVTGSHAFKVGMQDMWGTRHYLYDTNQAQTWTLHQRRADARSREYARPLEDLEHLKAELGIYAQDRWTIKTLTLNLGLRFDWHDAYVPAQDRPAITVRHRARHYDAIYDVPNWKDLSPRIGVAWDIFGNGKTVARGNFGNYLAAESTATATRNNPLNTSINNANRTWRDTNGNFVPDCDLRNPGVNGECLALDQPLGALNIVTRFDPAMLSGWGVRPNDREIDLGLAHSLTRNIALDVQYTDHWFGNFFATQNRANPASSYDQYCVNVPGDTRLPGGGGNQICQLYDLNPTRFSALNDNLITKAANFGKMSRSVPRRRHRIAGTVGARRSAVGRDGLRTRSHGCLRRDRPGGAGLVDIERGRYRRRSGLSQHAVVPYCPAVLPADVQGQRRVSASVVRFDRQRDAAEPARAGDSRSVGGTERGDDAGPRLQRGHDQDREPD